MTWLAQGSEFKQRTVEKHLARLSATGQLCAEELAPPSSNIETLQSRATDLGVLPGLLVCKVLSSEDVILRSR